MLHKKVKFKYNSYYDNIEKDLKDYDGKEGIVLQDTINYGLPEDNEWCVVQFDNMIIELRKEHLEEVI